MVKFENNLSQVSNWLDKAADVSVTETAAEIVDEIKQNSPKKTGELANSYTHQKTGTSEEIGSTLDWAVFVEFGTRHTSAHPALLPALVTAEKKLVNKLGEKLK